MPQLDNAPTRDSLLTFIRKSINKQFVIPVYQRNYTWTAKREVEKMLVDIESVLYGREGTHFMGIIMYLAKPINYYFDQLLIIDGQQRLTTTFLLLLAIRKYAKENDNERLYNVINRNYMYNDDVDDINKLRLKPLVNDDCVYQKIVDENYSLITKQEQNSNVFKNFERIYDWIEAIIEDKEIEDIMNVLNQLYIVCIPLLDSDNAQQIFESINSTGAPLTAADLIRNFILMNYNNDQQEYYYNTYWKELEKLCPNSTKLEEIFRFYLAIKKYNLVNKKDVYDEFKELWRDDDRGTEDKLKEVLSYTRYYNYIYIDSSDLLENIDNALKEFRKNLSLMPAPLLMEILKLTFEKSVKESQFIEIVNLINSYLIRRGLCDLDTSSITRIFPMMLKDIICECDGNYSDIVEIAKFYLINMSKGKAYYMPTDEKVIKSLQDMNAYLLKTTRLVLDKIEHFNNPAKVDLTNLNIEHIMPQKPNAYWQNITNLNEEEYSRIVNLLGNLTLCERHDNSRMGNNDFGYKKEILQSTSHLKINEEILQKNEWKISDIEERTLKLAKLVIQLYPYNESTYSGITEHQHIFIDGVVKAQAIFYDKNTIEVLAGSEIVSYEYNVNPSCPSSYIDLFEVLLDEGKIVKKEMGKYQFLENFVFQSVSASAGFILQGSRNGWDYWKHKDGSRINDLFED